MRFPGARTGASALALASVLLGCSINEQLSLLAPTASPTSFPTVVLSPSATPTEVPAGLPDLGPLQAEVSTVRGLYPSAPLQLELLAPEALRARVRQDFLADYTPEEAKDDAQVLALLGLVEPEFDLIDFYSDFYEEEVAGYYDTEAEKMYVVGEHWDGFARSTYAHEYVHALQDQTYDLEDGLGYNDEGCEVDSERCAALSALIEGDATLAEEQWWQAYSTPQDYEEFMAALDEYDGAVFDAAPAFMQQDFLFPYVQGLAFVRELFRRGGWAGVDDAYSDPPRSTEQILHPELFGKDVPIPVEIPDATGALGQDWRQLDGDVLGEWFTYLVLDEEIPSWEAETAAAGWGGDAYRAYVNDATGETALILITQWDAPRDAFEFAEAFQAYAGWRFGEKHTDQAERRWTWDRGAVVLDRAYDRTLWIVAPDAETADALRELVDVPA